MLIQYVSDIHLEFYNKPIQNFKNLFLSPCAPYLALCGDIAKPSDINYINFINWCSANWSKVFIIAGNHEYYNNDDKVGKSMTQIKNKIREIVSLMPNVFFLDCESIWLPDEKVRILGCTLWSNLSEFAAKQLNDFNQIRDENGYISQSVLRNIHLKEKAWLNQEIHKASMTGEKCIVLTHYLPSFQLIHKKYYGDPMNTCFASDCEDIIRSPVVVCLCGHSHSTTTVKINGVLCTLNPWGYPRENKGDDLNMTATVNI